MSWHVLYGIIDLFHPTPLLCFHPHLVSPLSWLSVSLFTLDCMLWKMQAKFGPGLPGRHRHSREQTLPQTSDIQTKLCLLVLKDCLISRKMADISYLEGDTISIFTSENLNPVCAPAGWITKGLEVVLHMYRWGCLCIPSSPNFFSLRSYQNKFTSEGFVQLVSSFPVFYFTIGTCVFHHEMRQLIFSLWKMLNIHNMMNNSTL